MRGKPRVERNNGFLETSFLPGRRFTSPADFNGQLTEWLVKANARTVRSIHGRPVDLLETDCQAMLPLPPIAPAVGLANRVRLARDYYIRIDANDYSVDPKVIGRFVDVTASANTVTVTCDGQQVARHPPLLGQGPGHHRPRAHRVRGPAPDGLQRRAAAPPSGH